VLRQRCVRQSCVATALCCDSVVLRQRCVATALCCDSVVLRQRCVATELCCDSVVLRQRCVTTALCCDSVVLRQRCVSTLRKPWTAARFRWVWDDLSTREFHHNSAHHWGPPLELLYHSDRQLVEIQLHANVRVQPASVSDRYNARQSKQKWIPVWHLVAVLWFTQYVFNSGNKKTNHYIHI